METVVYSKPNCPYCERAKYLLEFYGYEYEELVLDVDFNREELLEKFPYAKTFPQIIFEGEHIGGCDELSKLLG